MEHRWDINRARLRAFAIFGGLVAGTLDIAYACVFWWLKAGVPPERILQSVAKGLLGPPAFQGGAATAALGLFLHYFIATSMSFTYLLVARGWPALHRRPLLYGPAYGLLLYGIMNYVVVPLSAVRAPRPNDALWIVLSILVHMFLIGTAIAIFAHCAFRLPSPEARGMEAPPAGA